MHDTLISQDIIGAAEAQGKVKEITVEVGDLGHLPADELVQALKSRVDWEINIVRKKAVVKCMCGYTGDPVIVEHRHGHSVYHCPECEMVPEIVEGADIVLKEVLVE